jgi:hypothetical protein
MDNVAFNEREAMKCRDVFLAMVIGFMIIAVSTIFGGRYDKMTMDRAEGYVEGGQAVKAAFEAKLADDSPLGKLARVDPLEFQVLQEEVEELKTRVIELEKAVKSDK